MHMLFDSFRLYECFGFDENVEEIDVKDDENIITRKAWISFMFDGCLRLRTTSSWPNENHCRLLLELIALQTNTGLSAEENLRREIVAALAFTGNGRSVLIEFLHAL